MGMPGPHFPGKMGIPSWNRGPPSNRRWALGVQSGIEASEVGSRVHTIQGVQNEVSNLLWVGQNPPWRTIREKTPLHAVTKRPRPMPLRSLASPRLREEWLRHGDAKLSATMTEGRFTFSEIHRYFCDKTYPACRLLVVRQDCPSKERTSSYSI